MVKIAESPFLDPSFFKIKVKRTLKNGNYLFVFSNYVPRVEINVQVIEDEEEDDVDVDEANDDHENDVRN